MAGICRRESQLRPYLLLIIMQTLIFPVQKNRKA